MNKSQFVIGYNIMSTDPRTNFIDTASSINKQLNLLCKRSREMWWWSKGHPHSSQLKVRITPTIS